MSFESEITSLEKFNKRVEKLEGRSFMKAFYDKKSGVNFDMKDGKVKIERYGPTEEEYESALAFLRIFTQGDRHGDVTLDTITKIYDKIRPHMSQKLQKQLANVRDAFEKYLNSKPQTNIRINGVDIARRDVFRAFAYGEVGHQKPSESKKYESWKSNWLKFPFLENVLVILLATFFDYLVTIKRLNKKIIKQLSTL